LWPAILISALGRVTPDDEIGVVTLALHRGVYGRSRQVWKTVVLAKPISAFRTLLCRAFRNTRHRSLAEVHFRCDLAQRLAGRAQLGDRLQYRLQPAPDR
jgi:hypothetical protein